MTTLAIPTVETTAADPSAPGPGWVQNAPSGETHNILVPVVAGGLFLSAAVTIIRAVVKRRRKRAPL